MPSQGPLLTLDTLTQLRTALAQGERFASCSLDLGRSIATVELVADGFSINGRHHALPEPIRDRTIHHWDGTCFRPVARFSGALIKLIPTEWGAPTFEIDGIKMLPTARTCPYADAERKVSLIKPHGGVILDTCGGLGYFAAWCAAKAAKKVLSFEKNPDVLWLRDLNPWSPPAEEPICLTNGDITMHIAHIPDRSIDGVLHDPPRFSIAGELYSQDFYGQLARVLKPGGRLFHYTGAPNSVSRGRNLPQEVVRRLSLAGFRAEPAGDGILAVRDRPHRSAHGRTARE
jgi:hypothetical protein